MGPPIDVQLYKTDSLMPGEYYHLEEDSEYLKSINQVWRQRLVESFASLPPLASSLAIELKGPEPMKAK